MATAKTLTRKDLDAMVAELTDIQSKVKANSGTQSALVNQAKLATLSDAFVLDESFYADAQTITTLGDLANFVDEVVSFAKQKSDEAVKAHLSKNKTDDSEVTALRERFNEVRQNLNAAITLAPMLGISTDGIVVPDLRGTGGGRPAGSTGGKTVKNKVMTFGRTVNGMDHPQSNDQDSLSSMKWYHADKMGVPGGKKATMHEFRDFVRDNTGVGNPDMDAWEYTGEDGTVYWGRPIQK